MRFVQPADLHPPKSVSSIEAILIAVMVATPGFQDEAILESIAATRRHIEETPDRHIEGTPIRETIAAIYESQLGTIADIETETALERG